MSNWRVLKEKHEKIGVKRLWKHVTEERWAISLDNRTYHSWYEITPERAATWKQKFGISE